MARQPQRGYRGFVEWSNNLRTDYVWDYENRTPTLYTGLATSHGYQFNPWLFVGAGIDIEHCSKIDSSIIAAFVEGRTDLKFGNFTPFGDVRLGYNMASGGGVFFSPGVGYRFNWGRKMGINLGIGLTVQGYKASYYILDTSPDGYSIWSYAGEHRGSIAFFSFKIGIDF